MNKITQYTNQIQEVESRISSLNKTIEGEKTRRDNAEVSLSSRLLDSLGYGLTGLIAIVGAIALGILSMSNPVLIIPSVTLAATGVALLMKSKNAIKQNIVYVAYDLDIKIKEKTITELLLQKVKLEKELTTAREEALAVEQKVRLYALFLQAMAVS